MRSQPNSGLVAYGGLIVLLLCLPFLGSCGIDSTSPPTEILGIWSSDAPRYQNRSLEIRDDAVLFGTGKFSAAAWQPLIGVDPNPDLDGWRACTLRLRETDGAISKLALLYRTTPRPELRFANRQEVWTRSQPKGNDDV
jgi:hypothetical protein